MAETTNKERDDLRVANKSQRDTEDAYFCPDEVTNDQLERLLNDADRCAELESENQRLRAGIQVATNNYGSMGTIQMIRCSVTGNPSGTDTWMEGHPCKCDGCTLWVLLRSLLEDQADG